MSDIEKSGDGQIDNPFELAVRRGTADIELVREAESEVLRLYRLELRTRFETDRNVRESLPDGKAPEECREWVLDALRDACRPGTEALFERVVDELLEELSRLRKAPSALYLVDREGRTVMPIDGKTVYQPPDFLDEAGAIRKSKPIVHPGITSGLAMAKQAATRKEAAMRRARKSGPLGHLSLEHETDVESISRAAAEHLAARGYLVGPGSQGDGEWTSLEFGRETHDETHQSPNHAFHRFRLFGEILGRMIEKISKPGWTCEIGVLTPMKSSKQKWYVAVVRTFEGPND